MMRKLGKWEQDVILFELRRSGWPILVGLALAVLLSGCASSLLNPLPEDIPEGAEVIRCTKYEGIMASPWGGSSARFDGCQCLRLGKMEANVIVDISDCSLIMEDDDG